MALAAADRRISNPRYRSCEELRAELACAAEVAITGHAVGHPSRSTNNRHRS